MNMRKIIVGMLSVAAAVAFSGCASVSADTAGAQDEGVAMADAKPAKCKQVAPTTGSSIPRRDCRTNSEVQSVDGQAFMDGIHSGTRNSGK